jgi:hypothetical protein
MRCRHAGCGLIGMLMVAMAALAAIVAFMVVVGAVLAWLKRETWTLPAYRQARDRTGKWSVTPWSSRESGTPKEETDAPVEAAGTTP